MDDVSVKVANSAAWMIAFRLFERLLGVVSTLILARLLVPADFGLVAMAMAVFATLEVFGAFSFDLALVQKEHAERRHFDTAWTYTVLVSAASAIVLCAIAVPAARFYDEPRVEYILYALAVCAVIQGFENIGLVYFQKEITLGKEVRFRFAKRMCGFVVTVPLAFVLRNYWALVIGIIVSRVAGVWLSYLMHPYRPRFSLRASSELFHFSKWMLFNNILIFMLVKGVDFVIGKLAGAAALGLYSVAYEISNLPTTELVFPISRAVFPGYAQMSGDQARLRDGCLKVLSVVALFAVPAGVGIILLAEPIVHVVLGERWLGTVPLIQWLALYGIVRACASNTGSVYLALGKPEIIAKLALVTIATLAPLLLWLLPVYGVVGAAWSLIAASGVAVALNLWLLRRLLALRLPLVLLAVWRPVIASIAMALAVRGVVGSVTLGNAIADVLFDVLWGAAIYTAGVLVLWRLWPSQPDSERIVLDMLSARLSGLRARFARQSPN